MEGRAGSRVLRVSRGEAPGGHGRGFSPTSDTSALRMGRWFIFPYKRRDGERKPWPTLVYSDCRGVPPPFLITHVHYF